jgi:hypothetical protein
MSEGIRKRKPGVEPQETINKESEEEKKEIPKILSAASVSLKFVSSKALD